jgi:hypothetical protein
MFSDEEVLVVVAVVVIAEAETDVDVDGVISGFRCLFVIIS